MATKASLSSAFCIYILLDGEGTHVVENPGRAMKVIEVRVYNREGTPEFALHNSDGQEIVEACPTEEQGWKDMPISDEGSEVKPAQNLVLISESKSISQIVIGCLASGGGQPLIVL